MTDRSIKIVLGATVTGLVNGFKTAETSAKNLNKALIQNEQAARDLTTGLGLIGAAGVASAGLVIKKYADFDKAMSNVKATGAATATELTKLRKAAIDAGASTAFSATEAAEGIENLLKAGVSAKDVLGGGLAGALDLAAAGELDVASAAEIAATAMTQFKLGGEDVSHIADLLAAGAGKAQGSVDDMAAALKQGGLVAAQTGLSIEETTGTLAAFASAGLLGSDAGTSFKTMLQRLSAPTKENAELMAQLGISAYDAQGQFVGMSEFAGQLTDALGKMTPAQRNAALATIFGADAVRAAAVVYENGAAGITEWTAAVNDQGYAAEVAATRLDNLHGDLEEFGGAIESAFIRAGGAGNDALRGLVQGATTLVNALGSLDEGVLNTAALIVGGGGLVALGTAGLGKLVIGINEAKTALKTLGISAKTTGLLVGGVGAALTVAAVGLTVWAQNAAEAQARTEGYMETLDELGKRTDDTLGKINDALSADRTDWLGNLFGKDPESLIDIGERMGLTIQDLQGYILEEAAAVDRVNEATQRRFEELSRGGLGLSDARNGSEQLRNALDAEANSLINAEKQAAQKAQADRDAGLAAEEAAKPTSELGNALEAQAQAADEAFESMTQHTEGVLASRDAQRNLEAAIDEASATIKDNGKTLNRNTEEGRANEAALDGIASATINAIEKAREQGANQKKLSGIMRDGRKAFIDAAEGAGMTSREAKKLADRLGLVPKTVTTKVSVTGIESALSRLGVLDATLNSINGKRVTASVAIKQYGQAAVWTGGRLPGFPTGGRLPGRPPANPTVDNLLGVDERGMPRVRVRSREWVIREPAADYYGDRLMGAINATAIPRESLASALRGRASGGSASPRLTVAAEQTRHLAMTAASVRPASVGGGGGTSVVFKVDRIVTTDANAAADRLVTKARDAINTYGINALAQGVGV